MKWKVYNKILVKELVFKNQTDLAKYLLKVAILGDKMNHHVDAEIKECSKIILKLTTHDEQKITDKDYELAKLIDSLNN